MTVIRKAFGATWNKGLLLGLGAAWLGWIALSAAAAENLPDAIVESARVAKGPFRIDVTLGGTFEAKRVVEVSIRPKSWTAPMVVERAIELGTPVKKGDVLVEFDREKIDKAIQDAEVEDRLTEMAMKHAEEELPILEKSLPVELAAAERARAHADEDLKNFVEIDRPMAERMARFQVKLYSEWLAYAREELNQLEKMYRSKDLTEETEEIILRRQRFEIERYENSLKDAELRREQTLKVQLPRQDQHVRENAVKQAIELERARSLLPLNVNQKRLALAKLKHDRAKGAERLADLRADREAMTVLAPADGLVYYGRAERGQWSSAAEAQKLRKGGVIPPDEVFITVVAARPLTIRAVVEEKDLAALRRPAELKGRVTPTSDPDLHLPGRLASILTVPTAPGKFEALIDVDLDDRAAIRPGMACSVKFTPYRKDDALTVPAVAVFEEDAGDVPSHYVYLSKAGKDGKHPHRTVKTGRTASGKTEILEGLSEGDEVLTSKPSGE